jgi:capsular polysaccharide biosynthesis protein
MKLTIGLTTLHATGTATASPVSPDKMDNITFGLTMLLVGMGGTLMALWILSILIGWLTRLCQPNSEGGNHE